MFLRLPDARTVAYAENDVRGEPVEETSRTERPHRTCDAVRDLALNPAGSRTFILRMSEEVPCERSTWATPPDARAVTATRMAASASSSPTTSSAPPTGARAATAIRTAVNASKSPTISWPPPGTRAAAATRTAAAAWKSPPVSPPSFPSVTARPPPAERSSSEPPPGGLRRGGKGGRGLRRRPPARRARSRAAPSRPRQECLRYSASLPMRRAASSRPRAVSPRSPASSFAGACAPSGSSCPPGTVVPRYPTGAPPRGAR